MCAAGWKGTWVCEGDKHKALEMYKVRKVSRLQFFYVVGILRYASVHSLTQPVKEMSWHLME